MRVFAVSCKSLMGIGSSGRVEEGGRSFVSVSRIAARPPEAPHSSRRSTNSSEIHLQNVQFLTWVLASVAVALLCSAVFKLETAHAAEVEIVGTVEVTQADDFENDRSQIIYWLIEERSGNPFRLRPSQFQKGQLITGTVIRAKGRVEGDEFVISADGGPTESGVEVLQSAPAPSGERNLAVIIVDFQDGAVACSTEEIAASVFPQPNVSNENVSDFYIESSYGELGFRSDSDGDGAQDVFGPYKVNAWSTDGCDYYAWAYEAEDLAIADGVDLSLYKHLLFVLPSSNGCSGWGVANVGCGTQCRAWIWQCGVQDLYAHEIGHNLGFRHSSTDTNNDGTVDSEFGDYSDIMGYSGVGWRHPNAPHKDQQGWFDSYPDRVVTLFSDATLTLAPLELYPWETTLPQVIKLYKPDTDEYYYLSYRTQLGYSSAIQTAYTEALNVHRYKGSGSLRTNFITALHDGEQFEDGITGFTVTQLSHNPDPVAGYAEVRVSFANELSPAYVNFSNAGIEDGTSPPTGFDTLLEGVYSVSEGGTVIISGGSSPETIFISKAMTLLAGDGTVIMGSP